MAGAGEVTGTVELGRDGEELEMVGIVTLPVAISEVTLGPVPEGLLRMPDSVGTGWMMALVNVGSS